MENIYDLLQFFDATIASYDSEVEGGPFLEYDITNDQTIQLSFGFWGYEEYSATKLTLFVYNNIVTYNGTEEGYCVEASPEENGKINLLNGDLTINEFVKKFFEY